MFIDLTDRQLALRAEIDAYFAALMTPERRASLGGPENFGEGYRETVRQLGRDGWLGVGWPEDYGGRGWGALEQLIFVDAAGRAGVPLPAVTLNTVGPTLAQFGTDEQKQRFLPAILTGDVHFAIGYTEPEAGTDLASLRTRAMRDGDEYVVNGQKVFTTGGHDADYIWLAARTAPDAPKHEGISILIVDTSDPGFSSAPFRMIGGGHNNTTYYDNVRVPVSMRVGPEHGGWKMITTQLNFERVMLGPSGGIFKSLDAVARWARETVAADGRRVIELEWVRLNLARVRRQGRGGGAVQLAGRLAPAAGRAQPGGRLGHEGVRHRAAHRVATAAHGGRRRGGNAQEGVRRRRPRRQPRSRVRGRHHRHLRRRRERDTARDHRDGGPTYAARAPLSPVRGQCSPPSP